MTEPEIHLPVKCPICLQELLTGFRISVVADALNTGDLRLYANCHLASWDASEAELVQIREFLDATLSEKLREAEFSIDDLYNEENFAFIYTGAIDIESDDDVHEGSGP
ncbi:MAG: hypothetical protein ACLP2F_04540 [Steroidobacteraceae bacterium]